MKRAMISVATALAFTGLAVVVSVPASAESNTYFGFRIGIGNAPPPPVVVYTAPPQMDRERGSRVSYLRDDPGYDMFHYGRWYYMNSDGNWYRSRSYRGNFVACDVRRVPRQVFDVPDHRWHHRHQGERPDQVNRDRRGRWQGQDPGEWQGQDPGQWQGQDQGQRQDENQGQRHDDSQGQGRDAEPSTYFGFQIGVANAPPPPRVAYATPPQMERDSRSEVMFLSQDPGYDMFRFGSSYYISNDGYWYRSESYKGPFRVFDVRQVPHEVLAVPAERWHHRPQGGSPGQLNVEPGWRRDRNQGQDGYNH